MAVRAPVRLERADPDAQRLGCAERSFCLGVAAKLEWPGMACAEGCRAYREQAPSEYRRDLEGMAKMFDAIHELGWWEEKE